MPFPHPPSYMVDVHVRYVLAHFMAMASVCLLLHFSVWHPFCSGLLPRLFLTISFEFHEIMADIMI